MRGMLNPMLFRWGDGRVARVYHPDQRKKIPDTAHA
jgi:hypothetical protein